MNKADSREREIENEGIFHFLQNMEFPIEL